MCLAQANHALLGVFDAEWARELHWDDDMNHVYALHVSATEVNETGKKFLGKYFLHGNKAVPISHEPAIFFDSAEWHGMPTGGIKDAYTISIFTPKRHMDAATNDESRRTKRARRA